MQCRVEPGIMFVCIGSVGEQALDFRGAPRFGGVMQWSRQRWKWQEKVTR
jgi:hypothetical protein